MQSSPNLLYRYSVYQLYHPVINFTNGKFKTTLKVIMGLRNFLFESVNPEVSEKKPESYFKKVKDAGNFTFPHLTPEQQNKIKNFNLEGIQGADPEEQPETKVVSPSTPVEPDERKEVITQELPELEISERQFMFVFLKEISDLIQKGKELEESINVRNESMKEKQAKEADNNTLRDSASQIEESLKAFMTANENQDLIDKLKGTLDSFGKYLSSFEDLLLKQKDDARKEDAVLITKINARKAEIARLVNQVGGQTNFEKIKKYIRDAERISKIAQKESNLGNVQPSMAEMVKNNCVIKVSTDLQGFKMNYKSDVPLDYKLVDLLMLIFKN